MPQKLRHRELQGARPRSGFQATVGFAPMPLMQVNPGQLVIPPVPGFALEVHQMDEAFRKMWEACSMETGWFKRITEIDRRPLAKEAYEQWNPHRW